ncbi:hypothetical protein ABKV19_017577 [Rosa sericea]
MVENFLTGGEFLGEFMNLEENFFQYFQEDEEHTTFPKLPVPTTSTPFDDFTLHPVEQHRETLEETTQNGFRPWKWKSPLSPIPKRKNAGDPLRNGGGWVSGMEEVGN